MRESEIHKKKFEFPVVIVFCEDKENMRLEVTRNEMMMSFREG